MKKLFFFILLFILISIEGVAQTFSAEEKEYIDSLNSVLNNKNHHDTIIIQTYLNLSEMLYISNLDTMIYLCEKVKAIAEKELKEKHPKKLRKFYLKSLSDALNNIGYVHKNKGDVPKALDYYYKSLKISQELDSKREIATTLNNIGSIYYRQNDITKALEYYLKSLEIKKGIGDKDGIAYSLNNIGIIYYYSAEKEGVPINERDSLRKTSLNYLFKSLKMREKLGDLRVIAGSLNNIGVVYKDQGKPLQALEYYHKSLKIREELGDKKGMVSNLLNIGNIYLEDRKLNKAEEYAARGLVISKELNFPENIKNTAELLYKIYQQKGKGMKALEMHMLYITMRDTLNNEVTQKATAEQIAKYEYEQQKIIDDAKNDKLLAIEQKEKQQQQILTIATGVVLGLVILFLIFVFNRLRVTKQQKLVIEDQKAIVEEKNKEITDSITYAKRIQSAILPPKKLVKEYLKDSFIIYKPKDIVAGDFYWMEHKDNKVLFAAADCTGHGVPGAMVSVVCNNALNRSVREHGLTDPGEILDKTRKIVIEEFEKSDEEVKDGMDIALCSLEGNVLHYAGAHNPLWIIRDGEVIETKANKQPIGKFDNPLPYTTHSFELQKGDSIYIFSDGYIDQFGGEKGKKFKTKAFRELLLSIQDKSMEEQKKIIDNTFETWRGKLEQIDDVCIIGVSV